MEDKLLQRVRRIYAAVKAVEEKDSKKLKATVITTDKVRGVFLDFCRGFSDEKLSNYAHLVIHNIANLCNHLRKWAEHNSEDKGMVDKVIGQSLELQIIKDLSNNDKHGYPPRNGGHSGKYPKLDKINRVMRLATKAKAGSTIGMTLGADGIPRFFGDGNAKAVITGNVLDKDNNRIGDLYEIEIKAVEALEKLLNEFNINSGANGT